MSAIWNLRWNESESFFCGLRLGCQKIECGPKQRLDDEAVIVF
jgi:hypothetical protein